ncbi:hypothetical protein QQ054_10890 [Oscillatoria amoena NRMC-F 0135]|nr:hypothetical protein [Oscillatoria laete-virens]MDL5046539.1 hypothetical protein [Oscillatoria amoena NRMC-F 0135]MDL5054845.1 hypothetical protein [Oscillatoria laete-virens NRMC-F 0139]
MGEAVFDQSRVRGILNGTHPPIDNHAFISAIARRGMAMGWQESPE